MWYGLIRQVVLGLPFGNNPASDAVLILFWIIFGIAFPLVMLKWTKLIVEVREDGLYIRYTLFHLQYKKFLYKDITPQKCLFGINLDYVSR